MATVKVLLDEGQLAAAITAATQAVKARPADAAARTLLFDLLCFAGDLDRADKQLDVIAQQSAEAELGAQVYRNNIKAERARRSFFNAGAPPDFIIAPPDDVLLHLRAVNQMHNNAAAARALLDEAAAMRPALAGRLNEQPFQDFRDADEFTAPVLELFVQDQYMWLPFAQLRRLEVAPPRQLRDLLWLPARIETASGQQGPVFLPALYAASSAHANELVRLGRMTDWQELAADLVIAAGLHIYLADEQEMELPQVRTLEFAV